MYLHAEQSEVKNSADHGGERLAMSGGAALDGVDHGSEHSATSGAAAYGCSRRWRGARRRRRSRRVNLRLGLDELLESVGCSWAGPVARERINWWPMLADVRSSVDGKDGVTAERSRFT